MTPGQRFESLGHLLAGIVSKCLITPLLALFALTLLVQLGTAALLLGLIFLPVTLLIVLVWYATSAALQWVSRSSNKQRESAMTEQPQRPIRKAVQDLYNETMHAGFWWLEKAPTGSVRFWDALGISYIYFSVRRRFTRGDQRSSTMPLTEFEVLALRVMLPLLCLSPLALFGTLYAVKLYSGQGDSITVGGLYAEALDVFISW